MKTSKLYETFIFIYIMISYTYISYHTYIYHIHIYPPLYYSLSCFVDADRRNCLKKISKVKKTTFKFCLQSRFLTQDQVTEVVKNIQKYLKYSMVIKNVDCGISRPESKHQHFLALLSYSKPWLLNRERSIMIQALWSTNMLCFFFFKKSLLDLLQYCFCLTFFGFFFAMRHVGSQLPGQGLNPCPLHWKVKSEPLDLQGSPNVLNFC